MIRKNQLREIHIRTFASTLPEWGQIRLYRGRGLSITLDLGTKMAGKNQPPAPSKLSDPPNRISDAALFLVMSRLN